VAGDDQILRVLESIDRRLALLSATHERDMRQRLAAEVLRTPTRLRMFDAIDGNTGSPELARVSGASDRAAQQLVKDLLDLGFVRVVGGTTGRGFLVAKDEDAIVAWYLREAARQSDTANPLIGT
jgi:hypothetical protein